MTTIKLIAEALSPIVINEERQSSNNNSLAYIPGSTLRGALASAYLRTGGSAEDSQFKAFFIDTAPAIPNLIPTDSKSNLPSLLPFTAVSCKRNPGFAHEGKHGVSDTLSVLASSRLTGEQAAQGLWSCSADSCDEELKPINGFWNGDYSAPKRCEPSMSYNRFTGIDRLTRTVAQSILFSSRSIDDLYQQEEIDTASKYQRQCFSGVTSMDAETLATLRLLAQGTLFVGADKTRGYGEIKLSIEEVATCQTDYDGWNLAFREKLQLNDPPGYYFSVSFSSHAILVDRFLRPSLDLELGIDQVELVMKVAKGVTVRGWQTAWGLSKPDENGVKMGSVYLFRYTGDDLHMLKQRLELILREGVGLRREEGFGMVKIDDKLHTIKEVV